MECRLLCHPVRKKKKGTKTLTHYLGHMQSLMMYCHSLDSSWNCVCQKEADWSLLCLTCPGKNWPMQRKRKAGQNEGSNMCLRCTLLEGSRASILPPPPTSFFKYWVNICVIWCARPKIHSIIRVFLALNYVIKRTLFKWKKQDKRCKFSKKSSFSNYVQHKNIKTNS